MTESTQLHLQNSDHIDCYEQQTGGEAYGLLSTNKVAAAGASSAALPSERPAPETLQFCVRDQLGYKVFFRAKKTTFLGAAIKWWASHNLTGPGDFYFHGQRVRDTDTPAKVRINARCVAADQPLTRLSQIGLKNGDLLEVFPAGTRGGYRSANLLERFARGQLARGQ